MKNNRKSVWLDADGLSSDPPAGLPEETMTEISPRGTKACSVCWSTNPARIPWF
jgi:hypothetical protein